MKTGYIIAQIDVAAGEYRIIPVRFGRPVYKTENDAQDHIEKMGEQGKFYTITPVFYTPAPSTILK